MLYHLVLLQLNNTDYSSLEDYELEIVAQYLLDNKGAGYADRDSISQIFDEIIKKILDDWDDIFADVGALKIGYASNDMQSSVTQDITLPTVGNKKGAMITWQSSDPAIISASGQVTRPTVDTVVYLTATLRNRYEHYTVQFAVKVVRNNQ